MILRLYLMITMFAMLLEIYNLKLSQNKNLDIFVIMDELNESIAGIKDEKFKVFLTNLVNYVLENPLAAYAFMFLFIVTPIVHIFFIICTFQNIIKDSKEDK